MKKSMVLIVVISLALGAGLGALGQWYFTVKLPQHKAMAFAQKRQDEMNKMIRTGSLTAVKANEITLKVEHSGDPSVETGGELTLKIDAGTAIHDGPNILNRQAPGPGQSPGISQNFDATQYLKPGMKVDILEGDGRAVAIHFVQGGIGK